MKKVKLDLGKRSYPILIGAGLLKRAGRHIAALNIGNYAIVITNVRVKRLFVKSLRKHGITSQIVIVADSERSKSSATYLKVIQSIARKDVRKRPFIVALGGGVIGDLAGFVAATYKRGIPFVQIPTTLLAQVDSAIGGKVAIDLECGKNLLGAFYQPRLVLSDVTALKTLPKGILRSGLGEVIKYGVIKDAELFDYIHSVVTGPKRRRQLLTPLALLIFGCSLGGCQPDAWTGTIYPDGSNLARSITIGMFDSLESCRQACQSVLAQRGATADGEYECGLNCRPLGEYGVMICERTES